MEKKRKGLRYAVFFTALVIATAIPMCGDYNAKPEPYARLNSAASVSLGRLERSTLDENLLKPSLVSPDGTTYVYRKYFTKK